MLMKTEAIRMGQGLQGGTGQIPAEAEARAGADTAAHSWTNAEPNTSMEQVLERPLMRAYQRAVSNKGAAGVDQMPVTVLKGHLQQHWPAVRERLLAGNCLQRHPAISVSLSTIWQFRPVSHL